MTLDEIDTVMRRHRFRTTGLIPSHTVWTRGPRRRQGRRFVATLVGGRLDITLSTSRRDVAAHTFVHAQTPESLDAWVQQITHT